jgi:hypothetical protein
MRRTFSGSKVTEIYYEVGTKGRIIYRILIITLPFSVGLC